MNALLVIGATALLSLAFCAIYGALALLEQIPAVTRFLDRWLPESEGWDQ